MSPKVRIEMMLDGEIKTDPRVRQLVSRMSKLDWECMGGALDIQQGGDGDMGELLIPLLQIALEEQGLI